MQDIGKEDPTQQVSCSIRLTQHLGLKALASERKIKSVSALIQEALDAYLEQQRGPDWATYWLPSADRARRERAANIRTLVREDENEKGELIA